jgi:hypothetical protein
MTSGARSERPGNRPSPTRSVPGDLDGPAGSLRKARSVNATGFCGSAPWSDRRQQKAAASAAPGTCMMRSSGAAGIQGHHWSLQHAPRGLLALPGRVRVWLDLGSRAAHVGTPAAQGPPRGEPPQRREADSGARAMSDRVPEHARSITQDRPAVRALGVCGHVTAHHDDQPASLGAYESLATVRRTIDSSSACSLCRASERSGGHIRGTARRSGRWRLQHRTGKRFERCLLHVFNVIIRPLDRHRHRERRLGLAF